MPSRASKPTIVGRVVLFSLDDAGEFPAIICGLRDDGFSVDLEVFGAQVPHVDRFQFGVQMSSQSEEPEPSRWRWPS